MGYATINGQLRQELRDRDGENRCRWCGRVRLQVDAHHIRYRRSTNDDVLENLIQLCRHCHGFVHGTKLNGWTVSKSEAQEILWHLTEHPGVTGMSQLRKLRRVSA